MPPTDQERWDARYGGRAPAEFRPAAPLTELRSLLPARGAALDLAGGDGSNAIWLAQEGFDATLVDVSPIACRRASDLASRVGADVRCAAVDLAEASVPAGRFDVVVCCNYLQRDLWQRASTSFADEAWLVWVHPTRLNLERHERPSERFLLDPDEAASILRDVDGSVELLFSEERWHGDDPAHARHLARVVAKFCRG